MKHIPRKRFGQNFLTDQSVLHDIIASIDPKPDDTMVEIGPGLAAMTRLLLERLRGRGSPRDAGRLEGSQGAAGDAARGTCALLGRPRSPHVAVDTSAAALDAQVDAVLARVATGAAEA